MAVIRTLPVRDPFCQSFDGDSTSDDLSRLVRCETSPLALLCHELQLPPEALPDADLALTQWSHRCVGPVRPPIHAKMPATSAQRNTDVPFLAVVLEDTVKRSGELFSQAVDVVREARVVGAGRAEDEVQGDDDVDDADDQPDGLADSGGHRLTLARLLYTPVVVAAGAADGGATVVECSPGPWAVGAARRRPGGSHALLAGDAPGPVVTLSSRISLGSIPVTSCVGPSSHRPAPFSLRLFLIQTGYQHSQ